MATVKIDNGAISFSLFFNSKSVTYTNSLPFAKNWKPRIGKYMKNSTPLIWILNDLLCQESSEISARSVIGISTWTKIMYSYMARCHK